jgi:hypothetical protein
MATVVAWILWSAFGSTWWIGAPLSEPPRERPVQVAFISSEQCEMAATQARRLSHRSLTWVCLPDTIDPRAVHSQRLGGLR